jgi:hypothetical protein
MIACLRIPVIEEFVEGDLWDSNFTAAGWKGLRMARQVSRNFLSECDFFGS